MARIARIAGAAWLAVAGTVAAIALSADAPGVATRSGTAWLAIAAAVPAEPCEADARPVAAAARATRLAVPATTATGLDGEAGPARRERPIAYEAARARGVGAARLRRGATWDACLVGVAEEMREARTSRAARLSRATAVLALGVRVAEALALARALVAARLVRGPTRLAEAGRVAHVLGDTLAAGAAGGARLAAHLAEPGRHASRSAEAAALAARIAFVPTRDAGVAVAAEPRRARKRRRRGTTALAVGAATLDGRARFRHTCVGSRARRAARAGRTGAAPVGAHETLRTQAGWAGVDVGVAGDSRVCVRGARVGRGVHSPVPTGRVGSEAGGIDRARREPERDQAAQRRRVGATHDFHYTRNGVAVPSMRRTCGSESERRGVPCGSRERVLRARG